MVTVIFVIHILLCTFLIGLVLLQQGRGADAGAVTSGSGDSLLGVGGGATFISRLTTGTAIAFMVTSVVLVKLYSSASPESGPVDAMTGSVMEGQQAAAPNAPAPVGDGSNTIKVEAAPAAAGGMDGVPLEITPGMQAVPVPAEKAEAPAAEKPAEEPAKK